MIGQASDQMVREQAGDRARRAQLEAWKRPRRILDRWLDAVELLLERDERTVPEPLFREIGAFVQEQTPSLNRKLRRNRRRDAARVLDVLFDAQEELSRLRGVSVEPDWGPGRPPNAAREAPPR
jgi:hypothetical protein